MRPSRPLAGYYNNRLVTFQDLMTIYKYKINIVSPRVGDDVFSAIIYFTFTLTSADEG